MFGSRVGFSGSADVMVQVSNFKNPNGGLRPSWIYKNGPNFATSLPIDVMFGSMVGLSAELGFLP